MIGDGESAWRLICIRSSSPKRSAASYIAAPRFPRVPPPERIVSRPSAIVARGALSRCCAAPSNASMGKKCEWRSMFIERSRAAQIRLEKIERPGPRLLRRRGVIAVGRIGVKAVLRAGINFVAVRLVVFLHRRHGPGYVLIDAGIFLAVMREHRRLDRFDAVERLGAPAVKDDHGRETPDLGRRGESHLAAPAKSHQAQPVAAHEGLRLEIIERGRAVLGDLLPRR